MNVVLTSNIFALVKLVVCLAITSRAFYLYAQAPKPRMFILGLSIGVAMLTAVMELIGINAIGGIHTTTTQWFADLGLVVAYGFILLSALGNSSTYLRRIMLWQIIMSSLLLFLLLFIPILPKTPNPVIQLSLGVCRASICFVAFFLYALFFVRKESRYSLLMALTFLLLMLGNVVVLPQYVLGNQSVLLFIGNLLRTGGFIAMFTAFWTN